MQLIVFLIAYPLLWIISKLPFKLLYFVSDCVYVLVYKIIGYRKKVVRANIALALPELSEKERIETEKAFYHHLCDMFLEMIKTLSITGDEMAKRYEFTNIELVHEYEKKGKSIILMCSHYASWEWVIILGRFMNFKGFGIYKQLANPYFDKLVRDIRSKFDAGLIDTKHAISAVRANVARGQHGTYLFISDQTPKLRNNNYWSTFMGVEVPIHIGGEKLARELDLNVLYIKVMKVSRGHYKATFIPISDDVANEPQNAITEKFLRVVEAQIREEPKHYFWTHKRFKHKKN